MTDRLGVLEKWRFDEWGILLNCAKLFSSNFHKQIQELRNRKPLPDSLKKKEGEGQEGNEREKHKIMLPRDT